MGMERMNLRKSLALAAVLVNPLLLVSAQTPAAPAPTPVSVVIFSDYECPYSSDLFLTCSASSVSMTRACTSSGNSRHLPSIPTPRSPTRLH